MKTEKEILRLNSSAPITDGGRTYNKLYYIAAAIMAIIGFFSNSLVGACGGVVLGLVIAFCIKESILDLKLKKLRKQPFALDNPVPYENLIQCLIPVLSPLQMTIEKDTNGRPIITHKKMVYDIAYQDNNTFTIWWRKPFLNGLFNVHTKISYYRQVVTDMGIIGYSIQQICAFDTKSNI